MPQSSNGKVVLILIRWALGLVTVLLLGAGTWIAESIRGDIVEQGQQLDRIEATLDSSVMTDTVQNIKLRALTTKVSKHMDDETLHDRR